MDKTEATPISYTATGFGCFPCPGCGGQLKPGQTRITVPGVWDPWHADCFTNRDEPECPYCEEHHPFPHDGECLL